MKKNMLYTWLFVWGLVCSTEIMADHNIEGSESNSQIQTSENVVVNEEKLKHCLRLLDRFVQEDHCMETEEINEITAELNDLLEENNTIIKKLKEWFRKRNKGSDLILFLLDNSNFSAIKYLIYKGYEIDLNEVVNYEDENKRMIEHILEQARSLYILLEFSLLDEETVRISILDMIKKLEGGIETLRYGGAYTSDREIKEKYKEQLELFLKLREWLKGGNDKCRRILEVPSEDGDFFADEAKGLLNGGLSCLYLETDYFSKIWYIYNANSEECRKQEARKCSFVLNLVEHDHVNIRIPEKETEKMTEPQRNLVRLGKLFEEVNDIVDDWGRKSLRRYK